MAEDYVSQDQHRADLADLRLELSNTLASLDKRTELIAQDLMALRREMTDRFDHMSEQANQRFDHMGSQMTERFEHMNEQMTERFDRMNEQMTERFDGMNALTNQRFERSNGQIDDLRQDMRHLNTAVQRQMWALIAVVAGGAIKMLFFS